MMSHAHLRTIVGMEFLYRGLKQKLHHRYYSLPPTMPTYLGDAPSLPGCSADTLFLQDQAIAPVGCSICITAQSTIDLDCSVTVGTNPVYSWVEPNGVVSSEAVLEDVNEEGQYNCTVTNADDRDGVMLSTWVFCE